MFPSSMTQYGTAIIAAAAVLNGLLATVRGILNMTALAIVDAAQAGARERVRIAAE